MWTLHALLWIVLLAGIVHAQQPVRFPAASSFSTVDLGNPINRSSPLNKGLVGWWINLPQINRAGTTFRDISGYGHHGTLTNMATTPPTSTSGWNPTTRRGGYGQVAFDGTNDYIDAGGAVVSSMPLTLCGGFTTSLSSGVLPLLSIQLAGSNNSIYRLILYQGKVQGQTQESGGALVASITSYPLNTWAYTCVVFATTTSRTIYLNGKNEATNTTNVAAAQNLSKTFLGFTDGPAEYFSGSLDSLAIFNLGLSDVFVMSLYQEALAGYPQTLNRLPFVARASAAAASPARRFFQFFKLLPDGFQWPVPWRQWPVNNREEQRENAS